MAFVSALFRRYGRPQLARLENFSGGWNIRDAASELAPSDSPDCMNVTGDERGGVKKILGRSKYNPAVFDPTAPVSNTYVWASAGKKITQADGGIFVDTSTAAIKTLSTPARCGFADYNGKLFIIHPVDGLFSSDGTHDGTMAVATGPKGNALVAWQNRLIALGDPAHGTRLYASKLGDGTNWTIPGSPVASDPWTNDLRDVDDTPLTAFDPGSGQDIVGRTGLIVCKQHSVYRVNDSATGAYTVLSTQAGAASSIATASLPDGVAMITTTGIYVQQGAAAPVLVSQKLQPLFQSSRIAFDKASLFAAGYVGDRVRFSLPHAGATYNDLALEYHPAQGWIFPSTLAASAYATDPATGLMYGGSPSKPGQVYLHDSGGSDDGAPIASWWQSHWIEMNAGMLAQIMRLRINGRGTGKVFVRKDYAESNGPGEQFDLTDLTPFWDTGILWDNTTYEWGPTGFQQTHDVWGLGTCNAVAVRIEETSTVTLIGPTVAGSSPNVGAWALYDADILHTLLGVR